MPNWKVFKSAFKRTTTTPPELVRQPDIERQVHEQLLTSQDLIDQVGSRPKGDRLGGLWKMSQRYKQVQESLGEVNEVLKGSAPSGLAEDEEARKALKTKLEALIEKAETYIGAHSKDKESQRRKAGAMQALIDRAKLAIAVVDDPGLGDLPEDVTLTTALQMKRCGVLFKDVDFENFSDEEIDPEETDNEFGSGNANTVAKLVYGKDEEARTLIFKPEPEVDRNPLLAQKKMGIDLEAPHYGERNIASHALDKLLGGSTVVESRMVVHDGTLGLLMDKADGKMPGERAKDDVTEPQQRYIDTVLENNKPREAAIRLLKAMEFVEVDVGDGKTTWKKVAPRYADPFEGKPPSDKLKASVQQQLCGLEWADALSGQFDRHGENYLISFDREKGTCTVTGIDNDLAFGDKTTEIPEPGPDPLTGYNGVGLPVIVDRTTYDRMTALDWTKDVLPTLDGRLTVSEISATKSRFDALKKHAIELGKKGFVVDNWQTWRSPTDQTVTEFLDSQSSTNSYYKRDIHEHTTSEEE